jgi:hypothetical protein
MRLYASYYGKLVAEYKGVEETAMEWGYLEANYWRGQGPMGASAPLKKKMVCNFFVDCYIKCPLPCSVPVLFHVKCSHCVVLSLRTL